MERCPNCDAEVREGARFCTTCGYRFADLGNEIAATTAVIDPASQADAGEQETLADHAAAAWPTARSADEAPVPDGWSWQPTPAPAAPADSLSARDEATTAVNNDHSFETWASGSTTDDAAGAPAAAAPSEPFPPQSDATSTEPVAEPTDPLTRADWLLAELRRIIAASPSPGSRDLSGVVSELEVAITPPGAMPADELTALREAIFAARERPRDLDIVVDLTSRIEALVALVIAYDRATAAIERALDVLREPDPASAN